VPVIPIKVPGNGEVVIFTAWIGDISHERVNIVLVCWKPCRVEVADDGGSVDEIAIVEMVVVVVCVSEIDIRVACNVGGGGYETAPGGFVDEGVLVGVAGKEGKCCFEVGKTGLREGGVS